MRPANHLILCIPLLLLPSIFPSIRIFSNESALCIRWLKNRVSLVAQMVNNLAAMQETQVLSLGQEDGLKKGIVTHSSILTWRIP